jgi:hypothetical protein
MKNTTSKLGIFLAMFFFFFACNSKEQTEDLNLQYLEQIAKDDLFVDYQKIVNKLANGIAGKAFDLKAIHQELDKHPTKSICDLDPNILTPYAGGVDYAALHCELDKAAIKLHEKYPDFAKLSFAQSKKIRELSAQMGLIPSASQMVRSMKNELKNSRQ